MTPYSLVAKGVLISP